jgi:hypothetical protein
MTESDNKDILSRPYTNTTPPIQLWVYPDLPRHQPIASSYHSAIALPTLRCLIVNALQTSPSGLSRTSEANIPNPLAISRIPSSHTDLLQYPLRIASPTLVPQSKTVPPVIGSDSTSAEAGVSHSRQLSGHIPHTIIHQPHPAPRPLPSLPRGDFIIPSALPLFLTPPYRF